MEETFHVPVREVLKSSLVVCERKIRRAKDPEKVFLSSAIRRLQGLLFLQEIAIGKKESYVQLPDTRIYGSAATTVRNQLLSLGYTPELSDYIIRYEAALFADIYRIVSPLRFALITRPTTSEMEEEFVVEGIFTQKDQIRPERHRT